MDAEAYADMLPWLVFIVMDRKLGMGVAWAAGAALGCSAGLLGWSYRRGRYALLPRIAMGIFAPCLVAALLVPSWDDQVSLPRALVVATLGLFAFASLRFTPLSETYTVPLVAPAVRDDPRFRKVNVDMTLAWGVGSFAVALASSTTALLPGRLSFTLLDWVTPLVLATVTILWAARRWELFRLAVDTVPADPRGRDASVGGHLARRDGLGSRSGATLRPRGLTPLGLVQPERDTGPEEGPSREAVIRELPVRSRNIGAAGAE